MKELKFLVFTDLHYHPDVFVHDAPGYLERIIARAKKDGAAFIMQLGDFLHVPEKNNWLLSVYKKNPIPAYCAIGNHDTDESPLPVILKLHGLENNYYHFDFSGFRFIILDANYSFDIGIYSHFAPNIPRAGISDIIPPEQLSWFEKTINNSPYPCVIFSHQSLERTDGIKNRDELWKLINAQNRKRAGSVIMCINGHYHCDYCTFINGVCCLDLNSVSYHWTDPENSLYPPELCEKYPLLRHIIAYDSPLSAMITISTDEITRDIKIKINGAAGNFMYGLTEEELLRIDTRRLSYSRRCIPYINNYDIFIKEERCIKYLTE